MMIRISTIRTAASALTLISSIASVSRAQYQNRQTFVRPDTTAHSAMALSRDSSATARAVKPESPRRAGNFYVGFGAGASMPSGAFKNAYQDGWAVSVPMGWRASNGPLGVRADIAYSKWGGETVSGVKLSSAAVWDGMLDATVDVPFGASRTSSFYILGGGGVHYFPSYGSSSYSTTSGDSTSKTPSTPTGYPRVSPQVYTSGSSTSNTGSTTRLGLNGGAGFSFGLPHSALFVETRYVTVFTKNQRTDYWPVLGGLRWTIR